MLQDADRSLANWLRSVLPDGTGVRFETPNESWDKPQETAFIGAFLYAVRRDAPGRQTAGWSDVRDPDGRLVGRQPAVQHYRLSYLATARCITQQEGEGVGVSPAEHAAIAEHELLGRIISACSGTEVIPDDFLEGALAAAGTPTYLLCGADDAGTMSGLWPGLGIAPRAHVGLTVVAPVVPALVTDLAPPAREIVLGMAQRPTSNTPASNAASGPFTTARRWEKSTVTERTLTERASTHPDLS